MKKNTAWKFKSDFDSEAKCKHKPHGTNINISIISIYRDIIGDKTNVIYQFKNTNVIVQYNPKIEKFHKQIWFFY